MLNELAPDLWEYRRPLRVGGLVPFPRRTTLVRLPSGGLWVHNVNKRDRPGAREAIEALGPVQALIAPNRFHHFWVEDWQRDHPEARAFGAPGLAEKERRLRLDETLGDAPDPAWGGALESLVSEGHDALREVVFFHRPSKSLIVADWVFNIGAEAPWLTRQVFRLNGCYGRLAPSRVFKALASDMTQVAATTRAICERWDFERVVMAHGEVAQAGPSELAAAFGLS